jgi:hypothetical protein
VSPAVSVAAPAPTQGTPAAPSAPVDPGAPAPSAARAHGTAVAAPRAAATVTPKAWASSTAAAYFLLPHPAVRSRGGRHARGASPSPAARTPFFIAFGRGYRALFSGLVPIPAHPGERAPGAPVSSGGARPHSGIAGLAQSLARPLERPLSVLPPAARASVAYLLAGLLAGALALLAFSALPVRRTGYSRGARHFVQARSYVAAFALSLIAAVIVAYVLGAVTP